MREADDGPDDDTGAREPARGERDVSRPDADGPRAVSLGQRAAAADFVIGQLGTQQRMIDERSDLAHCQLGRNDPGGGAH